MGDCYWVITLKKQKMKRTTILIFSLGLFVILSCNRNRFETRTVVDENGYAYEMVTNDPTNTRLYTLDNGLKVYLSLNTDEPRIMTNISVRSGSLNDPAETTGLAHYFEHLLFKGTDEFGTSNWSEEKIYIDSISDMFEKHRNATTKQDKLDIYKEIDRLSTVASHYAIPNEYDRLTSAIGASSTNAFTNYETTTYVNEIPSNELKRWLNMEKERFSDPVLRLFHTELETVYEEYNMYQDMDKSRQHNALMHGLFPTHPLGRDIIGYPEDLKNPSMKNIMTFFNTWYVPNNMAIILSGDLDFEETIKMVDATFGTFEPKSLPEIKHPKEDPLTQVVEKNVYGPDAANVMFAYRFQGAKSADKKFVYMIDMILNNSVAGLIDLNLVQQQKVLKAGCSPSFMGPYGIHYFYGLPKDGQTLEQVKDLVLLEIEKVKNGEFDEWLMEAIINYLKVSMTRMVETNKRVDVLRDAFVLQEDLADVLGFYDEMSTISKDELVAFAKEHYKDNYVVVYKRSGEAKNLVKVQKPSITAIEMRRDLQSDYLKNFLAIQTEPIEPVFLNYNQAIESKSIYKGLNLHYIKNESNPLFELNFIWDMGLKNDKYLALAMNYLEFLGTDSYSAEEISKEFYKLGITFNTMVEENKLYISLTGLNVQLLAGLELLEHLMASAKPDSVAYNNLVDRILKQRNDQKRNQKAVQSAMFNYAKYGANSPFTDLLTEKELRDVNPADLTTAISKFNSFKHNIFYYGPNPAFEIANIVKKHHRVEDELVDCPKEKIFPTLDFKKKRVLLLNYPKSQVDVLYLTKDNPFDEQTLVEAKIFNEYYGGNMSSIVFQEIRESKALAYTAWAGFVEPNYKTENFYMHAVIYTQADKMIEAISTMDNLLNTMVISENAYGIACENIVKSIQTDRITKQNIFWTWQENQHLGINDDVRQKYYTAAQEMTLDDVKKFFDARVKDKAFTYIIIGNKDLIDLENLNKIAPVEELSMEQVFGY